MAEDAKKIDEAVPVTVKSAPQAEPAPAEHYEEVAEYRIGEGAPPLPLLVAFVLIIIWASISWIPFFGY